MAVAVCQLRKRRIIMKRPRHALFVVGTVFTFLALAPVGFGQPPAETPLTAPYSGETRWGVDDERGNGNTQGFDTRLRCAAQLAQPRARVYELGRVVSGTMPQNPFGDAPVALQYLATRGIPFTSHAGNGEVFSGGIGSQGTQFDALGHFGFLDAPWSGTGPFPAERVRYYNGFTQAQVKPSTDAPLRRLGVDKAVPIVTTPSCWTPWPIAGGGSSPASG
jgi:hypothetical protein